MNTDECFHNLLEVISIGKFRDVVPGHKVSKLAGGLVRASANALKLSRVMSGGAANARNSSVASAFRNKVFALRDRYAKAEGILSRRGRTRKRIKPKLVPKLAAFRDYNSRFYGLPRPSLFSRKA